MLYNTHTLAGPHMNSRLARKRIQSNIFQDDILTSLQNTVVAQICSSLSPSHAVPPTVLPFFPPLWPVAAPAAAAAGWSCHTAGCTWPSARPAGPQLELAPLGTTWRGHRGEGYSRWGLCVKCVAE